ncbi:cell wall-binding protein [Clostridium sp.]|uniref:N-acetylmuramoyl-L-alanine amidase family protein n=1 Tax=Clostridium sp. TaxID=1506 RepID=UPI002844C02E|nr:cell wall-binding protein [Clostridium sp.]MDR3593279.1 cell wall-binding protein [Clostridium sp.]
MIKRITKITGLLMSAALVISIMPVQAADIQNVAAQEGTIYNAKAKAGGIFIDGEINGQNEALYWVSADGKYNKIDGIDANEDIGNDVLETRYLEINTGATNSNGTPDYTYVDTKDNCKVLDYDVRTDLEDTAARTLKNKIKDDNNGIFKKESYENQEVSNSTQLKAVVGKGADGSLLPIEENGTDWYQNVNSGLAVYQYDLDDSNVRLNGQKVSTIYADPQGNYVDADYNLGNLRVCTTTTSAGASAAINNTEDSYQIKGEDGKTYDIKATLREGKYLTDSSDYIYRLAYLNIYKKEDGQPDSEYKEATKDFKFGSKGYTVATNSSDDSITVLQKFSKAPATNTIDGIKYSKDSEIYFFADDHGNSEYVLGKSPSDANKKAGAAVGGKTKITTSSKNILSSIYLDTTNSRIYAETITPKTKDSFNYIDVSSYDSSDVSSNYTSIVTAGGCPWFTNDGYIMTWDQNHNFIKSAKTDSGESCISVDSKDNMIAWDQNNGVYTVIHNVKPAAATGTATSTTAGATNTATTTGSAVSVSTTTKTGWVLNKDNTWNYLLENGTKKTGWLNDNGAWYYLKSDGAMATGWINDNGTWYYLNASGAMKTGWVNDNGTWYYLNESGAMLADTTVDGYILSSDGAWIG